MKMVSLIMLLASMSFLSWSQTFYNNTGCDLNVIFYGSPAPPNTACGDCFTSICVGGGSSAVFPAFTACSADAAEWDYIEICPSEPSTSCVDCGTPSCFKYLITSCGTGGLAWATTQSFTGCTCGGTIHPTLTGGDITVN